MIPDPAGRECPSGGLLTNSVVGRIGSKVARKSNIQVDEIVEAIVQAIAPGSSRPPQQYIQCLVNGMGLCNHPVRCAGLCNRKSLFSAFASLIIHEAACLVAIVLNQTGLRPDEVTGWNGRTSVLKMAAEAC